MIRVVSVETMRQIEAAADIAGVSYAEMMQHAGTAVARRVLEIIAQLPDPAEARVTLLIGPGNNGGDGLVAGRVISENSPALVRFYLLARRDEDDPLLKAVRDRGLFIAYAEDDQRYRVLVNQVASATIVVDALFGIGVSLPLRDTAAKLLRAVHKALDEPETSDEAAPLRLTAPAPQAASRPYILAVDCPSGLDCDTGALDKNALHADETITFIAAKPGLFDFPGAAAVGALTLASAGVPPSTTGLADAPHSVADPLHVRALLPDRPVGSNKGTFGKVLVLGGSVNYTGAPGLAARAAYRAGAGLVTIGVPALTAAALAGTLYEATWLILPHDLGVLSVNAAPLIRKEAAAYDALLIGPGWGREKTTGELLTRLLNGDTASAGSRRAIGFSHTPSQEPQTENEKLPPLVIDADGLNLLSEMPEWWKLLPADTILTPHPGEMARLAGTDTADVQARRWQIAGEKAREWNVILVLKGAHTLVANPNGEVTVLPFKTSALATAGTGDVLAGAIAGLLAQGLKPYEAAVAGTYLHGLAGEFAAETQQNQRSVIAGDVVEALGKAFQALGG